jgi:hypothetical protein
LEEHASPARQAHSLDERPARRTEHQDERPTGPRVLQLDVDLARRPLEGDVDPYGRCRLEDEEAGEPSERDRHDW